MKKAIKKLKKQMNAEVIELANAIKEDRRNIDELSVKYIRHMKRVSELFAELENKADRYEIQTIAKHVQNLEAEKEENCSCKEKSSIIDPDRPKETVSPLTDFRNAVAFHYANAVGKSIVDYIKTNPNQFKSGLAEPKRKTVQFNGEPLEVTEMQKLVLRDHFTLEDTDTQKTDKNATERQGEGKKEYSETIVTSEMFNDELESSLKELMETNVYPAWKHTSTDNSLRCIATLIYDLKTATAEMLTSRIVNIVKSKLKSKGEHYNKESDRYANIKDALKRNKEEQPELFANWTVVDKINSYKDKHIQWLIDTKGTEQTKTDLQEAYIDVICYCIMCYIYLKFNGEAKNG